MRQIKIGRGVQSMSARTEPSGGYMNRFRNFYLISTLAVMPSLASASVESTMQSVQNHLTGTILPLAAVLGLIFAGLSYVTGSANARSHLVLAIVGTVVGFGAQSIVDLIRTLVH